jgi:hypothetical protein
LIELAYEGVTVEQVLERRLREHAFGPASTTERALEAAEQSILLLSSPRLTEDLGDRAVHMLVGERGALNARHIFEQARRLVHHFRGTPRGLPSWLEQFVTTGYQHYATMLPDGFRDRGTSPEQLAAMLAFVFTLESLALSLGCERSQLLIAIEQSAAETDDPNKVGLLWVAEWLLDRKSEAEVRAAFSHVIDSPLLRRAFPSYLSGLLLGLELSPRVATVAVELLSRAFAELPDAVLLPWLPGLFSTLQPLASETLPALMNDLMREMPTEVGALDRWVPPWQRDRASPPAHGAIAEDGPLAEDARATRALLLAHREPTDALALAAGGEPGAWSDGGEARVPAPTDCDSDTAHALLLAHPATMLALAG